MSKVGYGVAFLKVLHAEKWMAYGSQSRTISKKYGAQRLAGGLLAEKALYLEGQEEYKYDMSVLMTFPSFEKSKQFYESEEYQAEPLKLRQESTEGIFLLLEGNPVPSGYTGVLIAAIKVTNAEQMSLYNPSESIATYNGEVLFKSKEPGISDGFSGNFDMCVGLAFPTAERALEWMGSSEYKEMLEVRLANSKGPLVILDMATE